MHLRALFARLFARHRTDADMQEELAQHLDMAATELRVQGISPDEAERQARLRFGGVTQTREAYRQQARPPLVDSIAADLRYAARQLRRNRGFATVAILTLALGIGATTAIYSLVSAVLLRSLPYGHAEQLVYLYTPNAHIPVPPEVLTPTNADFHDIRQSNHSFSAATQFAQAHYSLSTTQSSERVGAAKVDGQFFSTMELSPQPGRAINDEDNQPGHDHVAVISQFLWRSQFNNRADILSIGIDLDGSAYRIIGVMPPDVRYPSFGEMRYGNASIHHTDIWIPLALTAADMADRVNPNYYAIARLKSGVSVTQAQADMSVTMQRLDRLHTVDFLGNGSNHGWTALVKSVRDTAVGPVRPLLRLLLGAVCCVLWIACGNTASLLLARTAARSHEFGVRATLGAERTRLIRQLLTESLLLSSIAGVAGIALGWLGLHLLLRLDPGDIPRLQQASLDARALLCVTALVFLTCLLSGLLPALSASRVQIVGVLKAAGARGVVAARDSGRNLLIIGEVALVVVLLAGAGLLLRSYSKLTAVQPGFSSSTVTCDVSLDWRYAKPGQGRAFFQRLLDKLAHIPGVTATGAVTVLPFSNSHSMTSIWVDGYRDNSKDALIDGSTVSPHYFSAMQTPLIAGRFFADADRGGDVIVNQSFVRKYFPGQDAVGKRLRNDSKPSTPWKIIVGVVADVRYEGLDQPPAPQLYGPLWNGDGIQNADIVVRSSLPPTSLIASMRAITRSLDPSVALADMRTMQQAVAASTARRRFQTMLLSIFAVAALLLALVGLYGLLAYSVRQRVAEIGVRIALGASRPHVIGMVVRQGLRLVGIGIAVGIAAAAALTRLLASSLYGVSVFDPRTFFAAPLLVILAATAACAAPAWRAAHIEPVAALRSE